LKASEKRKDERRARHIAQMREIEKAIISLEKSKRALANRKSAAELNWFE
jgi:hypothetical protein